MSEDTSEYSLDSTLTSLNTDQAIEKVGGAGRYQVISALIIALVYTMEGRIIYSLPYLQGRVNISIYCTSPYGTMTSCDKVTACNQDLTA